MQRMPSSLLSAEVAVVQVCGLSFVVRGHVCGWCSPASSLTLPLTLLLCSTNLSREMPCSVCFSSLNTAHFIPCMMSSHLGLFPLCCHWSHFSLFPSRFFLFFSSPCEPLHSTMRSISHLGWDFMKCCFTSLPAQMCLAVGPQHTFAFMCYPHNRHTSTPSNLLPLRGNGEECQWWSHSPTASQLRSVRIEMYTEVQWGPRFSLRAAGWRVLPMMTVWAPPCPGPLVQTTASFQGSRGSGRSGLCVLLIPCDLDTWGLTLPLLSS